MALSEVAANAIAAPRIMGHIPQRGLFSSKDKKDESKTGGATAAADA